MKCKKGHSIPENLISCPTCACERSEAALREVQAGFLCKLVGSAGGALGYTLRVAEGTQRHVLMFTSRTHTFCDHEFGRPPKIINEAYSEEALAKVCAGCRIEFNRMMQEIAS